MAGQLPRERPKHEGDTSSYLSPRSRPFSDRGPLVEPLSGDPPRSGPLVTYFFGVKVSLPERVFFYGI